MPDDYWRDRRERRQQARLLRCGRCQGLGVLPRLGPFDEAEECPECQGTGRSEQ